jgi:hypothetical protein
MSGIFFDPNGVSMDRSFETNEFKQVINLLDKHKDDIDINIYNNFKEIFDKAKEQNDRNIHMVVTEPVEYEYDDW